MRLSMLSPLVLRFSYHGAPRSLQPKVLRATLRTSPSSIRKAFRGRSPSTKVSEPLAEASSSLEVTDSIKWNGPNASQNLPKATPSKTSDEVTSKAWGTKQIPVDKLSHRWETLPPTDAQLEYADKFFTRRKPDFLWSAPRFHSMSFGDSPEVCVLGRSNIGKSSLLNALFGRQDIAHSSSRPGRTRTMNAFAIGDAQNFKKRLVVLDMPGYGKGGQAEWGTEILKYLNKRKQLTRAFLLVDSEHGLKKSDNQLLALFRQQNISHQVVFSKVDKLLFPSAVRIPSDGAMAKRLKDLHERMEQVEEVIQPDTEDESGALGEIIACSSEFKIDGKRIGINLMRHAMLQAAGLEYQTPLKHVKTPEIIPFDKIPGMSSTPI